MREQKPVALVIGASRGLGRAIAVELARADVHVVAVARSTSGLEKCDDLIQAATGEKATLLSFDLLNHDQLAQLPLSLAQRFGRLDYFIHAAAELGALTPIQSIGKDMWQKVMQVNVGSVVELLEGLLPLMQVQKTPGRICLFDDPSTCPARPYWGAYAASKAALRALAQSLQAELKGNSVTLNLISPPAMPTKLRSCAFPGEDISKLCSPEEVARGLITQIIL